MFIVNKKNLTMAKQLHPWGLAWIVREVNYQSSNGEAVYGLHVGADPGLQVAISDDWDELVEYARKQGWMMRSNLK